MATKQNLGTTLRFTHKLPASVIIPTPYWWSMGTNKQNSQTMIGIIYNKGFRFQQEKGELGSVTGIYNSLNSVYTFMKYEIIKNKIKINFIYDTKKLTNLLILNFLEKLKG